MVNSIRKTIRVAAVKSPFFGDRRKAFMDDLAVATGGTVVNPEIGLKLSEAGLEVLGTRPPRRDHQGHHHARRGRRLQGDVEARIAQLKREIDDTDSDWDREKLQERLAKLSGGVAVIKVGAATETELKERKHRIEDAVAATRAAVEEGIVPGGGAALRARRGRARRRPRPAPVTRPPASRWCAGRSRAPLRWIAANARARGLGRRRPGRRAEWGHGYNAATLTYGDLMADGIIDPVKVTRSAVVNAASIARMVLTTESAVVDKPETARAARRRVATATGTATSTTSDGAEGHRTGTGLRRDLPSCPVRTACRPAAACASRPRDGSRRAPTRRGRPRCRRAPGRRGRAGGRAR